MKTLNVLLMVFIGKCVVAQIEFAGECPSVEPVQNFNLRMFTGQWYDWKHYSSNTSKIKIGECMRTKFTSITQSLVRLDVVQNVRRIGNCAVSMRQRWLINRPRNSTDGGFYINFDAVTSNGTINNNTQDYSISYNILATNYKGFAIIWSCVEYNTTKNITKLSNSTISNSTINNATKDNSTMVNYVTNEQYVWILSRHKRMIFAEDRLGVAGALQNCNFINTKMLSKENTHRMCDNAAEMPVLNSVALMLALFCACLLK